MIEDIKKEIYKQEEYYMCVECNEISKEDINKIYIKKDKVFEILDKYKEYEDIAMLTKQSLDNHIENREKEFNYKNAWEELKNDNTELIEYGNRAVKDCKLYKNKKMYLLEQKYNIGVE